MGSSTWVSSPCIYGATGTTNSYMIGGCRWVAFLLLLVVRSSTGVSCCSHSTLSLHGCFNALVSWVVLAMLGRLIAPFCLRMPLSNDLTFESPTMDMFFLPCSTACTFPCALLFLLRLDFLYGPFVKVQPSILFGVVCVRLCFEDYP